MDREKAQGILEAYGRPSIKTGNSTIVFARQKNSDLEEIESKTNEELIDNWKALVFMNFILGTVSLNEIQRISLIELEMEHRSIPSGPLNSWYNLESDRINEQDIYEEEE
jgi:hypothetical protein